MVFACLFFLLAAVSSSKLSVEENRDLQETCGKHAPPAPLRGKRSIHTKQVARSESPWVARLEEINNWFPNITMEDKELMTWPFCTGTLISPRHILTAGHCIGDFESFCDSDDKLLSGTFKKINIDRKTVMFTESCWSDQCENRKPFSDVHVPISKIFVSKSFTGFNCKGVDNKKLVVGGDMAVIELAENVTYNDQLYPACLSGKTLQMNNSLTLFGYGVNESSPFIEELRKLETKVGSCQDRKPAFDSVCDTHEMASACKGDSGGGKMIFDTEGRAFVAATVSGGAFHCSHLLAEQNVRATPSLGLNAAGKENLHWICAATGICQSKEVSETVASHEASGMTRGWFHTLLPLKGNAIYA